MVRPARTVGLIALLLVGVAQAAPVELPLSVAVADVDGAPAVDRSWIDAQVARANAVFEDQDIRFRLVEVRGFGDAPVKLEDRKDRDALGRLLKPGVINLFVPASLRDIHEPELLRRGVHWRPRSTAPGKHLVVVAAYAGVNVLAHELGHFFGNRKHPNEAGNVMSYLPKLGVPGFNEKQSKTIARFLSRFLRSKELVPLATSSAR